MFWGHRLKYGFVGRNETGHSVVGIDFHVVPWPLYKESRQDGKRSRSFAAVRELLLGDGRARCGGRDFVALPDASCKSPITRARADCRRTPSILVERKAHQKMAHLLKAAGQKVMATIDLNAGPPTAAYRSTASPRSPDPQLCAEEARAVGDDQLGGGRCAHRAKKIRGLHELKAMYNPPAEVQCLMEATLVIFGHPGAGGKDAKMWKDSKTFLRTAFSASELAHHLLHWNAMMALTPAHTRKLQKLADSCTPEKIEAVCIGALPLALWVNAVYSFGMAQERSLSNFATLLPALSHVPYALLSRYSRPQFWAAEPVPFCWRPAKIVDVV